MFLSTARNKVREGKCGAMCFMESCALSVLFLRVWYSLRWESEINGRAAAVAITSRKRSERTDVWSPFNHGEQQGENPGRLEGDSCSGGYEGDDPPGSEMMIVTENANEVLKRQLARGLNCRMRFAYDNAVGTEPSLLLSNRARYIYPCAVSIVFDIYVRGVSRIFHCEISRPRACRMYGNAWHVFLVCGKFIKLFCRTLLHPCAMNVDDTLDVCNIREKCERRIICLENAELFVSSIAGILFFFCAGRFFWLKIYIEVFYDTK